MSIADCDDAIGNVFNAASNFEISVGETASLIAEVMNKEIEIVSEEKRLRPKESEVNRLFGDNSRLKNITGWEPRFSGKGGFKKGLRLTAEWFQEQSNLAFYKSNTYAI